MLGFNNCMKIADVPFPFPYAQLLTILLTVYACFIPIYITIFTDSLIASPILAFLLFEGIWGVNEVAKELENPFGPDTNDISLVDFHSRFLEFIQQVTPKDMIMSDFAVKDTEVKATELKGAPGPAPTPTQVVKPDSVTLDMLPEKTI